MFAITKMKSDAKELSRVMKVLSVETRIRILEFLRGQALCVNALAARLNLTPGAVSQHLRIMRDAHLVVDEKRGYYVHYRLNEATLAAWRGQLKTLLGPGGGAGGPKKGGTVCAVVAKTKPRNAKSRKN